MSFQPMSSIIMKNTFGFGFSFAPERRSVESSLAVADDALPLPVRPHALGHHQLNPAASSPAPDHHPAAPDVTAAVDDYDCEKIFFGFD